MTSTMKNKDNLKNEGYLMNEDNLKKLRRSEFNSKVKEIMPRNQRRKGMELREPLEVPFHLLEAVVDHLLDHPDSVLRDLSNSLVLEDLEEDLEVHRMDHRLEAHLALEVQALMDRLEVEEDVGEGGGEAEVVQMV